MGLKELKEECKRHRIPSNRKKKEDLINNLKLLFTNSQEEARRILTQKRRTLSDLLKNYSIWTERCKIKESMDTKKGIFRISWNPKIFNSSKQYHQFNHL
jgi:uncharacterized Fe-S radical SAM superfamily protein PflX